LAEFGYGIYLILSPIVIRLVWSRLGYFGWLLYLSRKYRQWLCMRIVPKSREVSRKIVILLDSYLFPLSKRRNCQQLKRIELYDCQLITRAGIRKLKVSAYDGNHITGSECKKYLVSKLWKKELKKIKHYRSYVRNWRKGGLNSQFMISNFEFRM